jgi:CRP-like cAMP-binding protein
MLMQNVSHATSPETVISALFDGPERTVPKGARIFCPGDASDTLFLLRRGLVKLSTRSPKGEELTLRVYRPAEIFGEGCFCRTVHRYWATALEASQLVESSAERALETLMQSPETALELVVALTERLTSAYDELQTVSSRMAVNRIVAKLLALPGREPDDDRWTELANRFTHEELARIVGVRRETLSRALSRLRGSGMVDYAAGRPMRVDRSGLRAFLGGGETARTGDDGNR